MRIQTGGDLQAEHIKDTVRSNLSRGYNRGLWNQEVGAVFLVTGDNTVTTVIPDSDIPEKDTRLDEEASHCDNCEALIMEDCEISSCRWCGEEDYQEPVTSISD